jgi:hypothetical protein
LSLVPASSSMTRSSRSKISSATCGWARAPIRRRSTRRRDRPGRARDDHVDRRRVPAGRLDAGHRRPVLQAVRLHDLSPAVLVSLAGRSTDHADDRGLLPEVARAERPHGEGLADGRLYGGSALVAGPPLEDGRAARSFRPCTGLHLPALPLALQPRHRPAVQPGPDRDGAGNHARADRGDQRPGCRSRSARRRRCSTFSSG